MGMGKDLRNTKANLCLLTSGMRGKEVSSTLDSSFVFASHSLEMVGNPVFKRTEAIRSSIEMVFV